MLIILTTVIKISKKANELKNAKKQKSEKAKKLMFMFFCPQLPPKKLNPIYFIIKSYNIINKYPILNPLISLAMTEQTTKGIFTTILVEYNPKTQKLEKGEIVPQLDQNLKQENEKLKQIIELFDKNDFSRKLHDVIETNQPEKDVISIVGFMLKLGADPYFETPSNNYTALYNALKLEKYEIADLLIKNGVDVNKPTSNGEQIVFRLIRNNCIKQLEFLLKNGLDLNVCSNDSYNDLPIGAAVKYEKIDIVKLFIENGADINKCNKNGKSTLILAIHNSRQIFKLLIEHGADINKPDNDGDSPLHLAIYRNETEMSKLLIEYGADVNKCDNNGNSPLHLVIDKDKTEIAKLLIEHGADVNICNNNGNSPLIRAIYNQNFDIFKILIEKGANLKGHYGVNKLNPLEFAVYRNDNKITKFLLLKKDLSYDKSKLNSSDNKFYKTVKKKC